MVYMGSKRRLAKELIPIITADLKEGIYYVEPFCGGCNMIDKINHPLKIASDSNKYLIALLQKQQQGTLKPFEVSKEVWQQVKYNKDKFPMWFVGYVGFCCSFRGVPFRQFASNNIQKKSDKVENYQTEQANLLKQNLSNIDFKCCSYDDLQIPPHSVIYCDPPYMGTTGYNNPFDSDKFWQWVREKTQEGHKVYVSEYQAPEDFTCIWQKEQTKNLGTKAQKTVEKLFIWAN